MKGDMLELFTKIFVERKLTEQQKCGVVVCIPKTARTTCPADFRPITLMNIDYIIVARIIASRTRLGLMELLYPSQYYGVPGKTIFEASATVRGDNICRGGKHPPMRVAPGFQRSI